MKLVANNIVKGKFWDIKVNGKKVGFLEANQKGFTFKVVNILPKSSERFATLSALKKTHDIEFKNQTPPKIVKEEEDYILSEELKTKWDTIEIDEVLLVDISVACYVKISGAPSKKQTETDSNFQRRYENWLNRKKILEIQRVDLEMQRQDELDAFIIELGGERRSDFVGYEDSFSCRVLFSGKALKDFVINYQYLFDVSEYDDLTFEHPETGALKNW